MSRTMTYIIPGNPIPLARPRINMQARTRKRMYDPQQEQRLIIGITLQQQHKEQPLFVCPIQLVCMFYMPIPNSISPKKRSSLQANSHIKKPDLSNLIKFYEDVASGILFPDDSIICSVTAHKLYDTNPRTEITIKEMI